MILDFGEEEIFGVFVNEFSEVLTAIVSRDEDREPWLLLLHSDAPDLPITIGTYGEVDEIIVSAEERVWLMSMAALWLMRGDSFKMRKELPVLTPMHPRRPGGFNDR